VCLVSSLSLSPPSCVLAQVAGRKRVCNVAFLCVCVGGGGGGTVHGSSQSQRHVNSCIIRVVLGGRPPCIPGTPCHVMSRTPLCCITATSIRRRPDWLPSHHLLGGAVHPPTLTMQYACLWILKRGGSLCAVQIPQQSTNAVHLRHSAAAGCPGRERMHTLADLFHPLFGSTLFHGVCS
jgi:hypothetical protein